MRGNLLSRAFGHGLALCGRALDRLVDPRARRAEGVAAEGGEVAAKLAEVGAEPVDLTGHRLQQVPEGHAGARFLTDRTAVHSVAAWLKQNGWAVITAELGYIAKTYPELDDTQRGEVGEFLQALEDNDDVQRVWAAVK